MYICPIAGPNLDSVSVADSVAVFQQFQPFQFTVTEDGRTVSVNPSWK